MSADTLTLAIAELEGRHIDSIITMDRVAAALNALAGILTDQSTGLRTAGNAVVDARRPPVAGRPKRRQLQVVG